MRTAGILVLMAVVGLNASSVVADDNLDASKAAAKIEFLGGVVTRDETLPDRPVAGVSFVGSHRFSDKYLRLLAPLKKLSALDLSNVRLSDSSLNELSGLRGLTMLILGNTYITDVGH